MASIFRQRLAIDVCNHSVHYITKFIDPCSFHVAAAATRHGSTRLNSACRSVRTSTTSAVWHTVTVRAVMEKLQVYKCVRAPQLPPLEMCKIPLKSIQSLLCMCVAALEVLIIQTFCFGPFIKFIVHGCTLEASRGEVSAVQEALRLRFYG